MASILRIYALILFVSLCVESKTKSTESNESSETVLPEFKPHKMNDGPALMFADEFKQTLERYLFGICPQNFKVQLGLKTKNNLTAPACDVDVDQHDLAGRLATLSLRAHSASRSDCSRFGTALANTLGELAKTAAKAQTDANKKRKLSKSQKAKIQAKQRTALAVKKKAAAAAAAAAAKMASTVQ